MKYLLLAVFALLVAMPLWRATDKIDVAASAIIRAQEQTVEVLESTWKSEGPLTHTVKTPRQSGESLDSWQLRHKQNVDGLKALYPPI